jgi:hypothetical protein
MKSSIIKWWLSICSALFIFLPTIASANTFSSADVIRPSSSVVEPSQMASTSTGVQIEPIRSYRSSTRSYGSRSYSYSGSSSSRSYSSGLGSGLGSHLFSFGAGMFFAHLLSPVRYSPYGGYGGGFSIFHILLDVFVLWIIWRIVRRMFR